MIARSAAIALLLLVGGCVTTSPPVTHIQLTTASTAPGSAPRPRVLVGAVQVPDYLLRNQLLRRVDAHEVRYDAIARWAEPLDIAVQRVITGNLAAALDSNAVISFPSRTSEDLDWRIEITLRHFEADARSAHILADLMLTAGDSGRVDNWQFERERRLTDDSPGAVASTLSDLLGELSDSIAARIGTDG
jgi:uncharacterized lipoprotein YmbA